MSQTSTIHLKQTEAFIDENPSAIRILRVVKEKTAAGGFVADSSGYLPVQKMRLVPINRVGAVSERMTSDGRMIKPDATIVGMPDADIQRGDKFLHDGLVYEVVFLSRGPKWRTSAEVSGLGS